MGNLKKYLQELSPAAKASFWFVVANLVLKGISFITTPIFTRLLTVSDYGATSVFLSWESVISIFATLSLAGGVYNVAMTKYEDDVDGFTSSMLTLTAISCTVTYLLCIGFNLLFPNVFKLNTAYLVFMWIQTFTNACATFWLMRKRFHYQYKSVIAYTFFNAFSGPIIAIIAIFLFPQDKAMAKVIGAGIGAIVLGFLIFVMLMKKGKKPYDKQYWLFALKFNIPLIPHYLSSVLLSSSDKLMINSMVGKAQAGIYGISHSITGVISLVTQSINMSLIPYTLQSIKNGNYKGLKRTTTYCTLFMALSCSGIMLFAREGVLIFATEEYLPAIQFVIPLSFAVLVDFLSGIIGNIVFYYEKTAFMSRATLIAAILNIILNYFGILKFGYLAAGYTTLISSVVKFALYYYGAHKYEKNLKEIINLKLILLIYVGYVGLMLYALMFLNNLIARVAFMLVLAMLVIMFRKKIFEIFKSMKTNS